MSVIDTLVTDRIGGAPYGHADLNRVAEAVAYINNRLTAAGFNISVTARQDWTRVDIPAVTQMAAYLADITAMRGALAVYASTPAVPQDMNRLTAEEANDIEKILVDVDGLITNMVAAYRHSGTMQSGQGGLRL